MQYHSVYNKIIESAKNRTANAEYSEVHHIIPKSLGGNNSKDNLVRLTAREHYLCHVLLVKMHNGQQRHKMLYALNAMKMNNQYQYRVTSRIYESLRKELQALKRQEMTTNNPMDNPEYKEKHHEAMKTRIVVGMSGRTHNESTKLKMKAARAKQVITEETKRKISELRKIESAQPDYINGCRIGWYITPWGRFVSLSKAAEGQPCNRISIKRWCRINNDKKVLRKTELFSESDVGKTFAELGFGFEELQ